jgi:hypothetical protein
MRVVSHVHVGDMITCEHAVHKEYFRQAAGKTELCQEGLIHEYFQNILFFCLLSSDCAEGIL